MNKIIVFLFCISSYNCSSQFKINKSKDIDILTDIPQKQNTNNNYLIKNNSNRTYIIDPFGFYGDSKILVNNIEVKPTAIIYGEYYRFTDKQCANDLIVLKPKENRRVNLNLAYNVRELDYDYSKFENFARIVKSYHNRNNATIVGCNSFIEKLEKKGYHVLTDTIDTKILYVK